MSVPYSIRVMSGRGSMTGETFTVPEGKRLVVRAVSLLAFGTVSGNVRIEVHGVSVYYGVFSTAGQFVVASPRWTAYERETVQCLVYHPDVRYHIDGYLLTDTDGRPDDADNTTGPLAIAKPVEHR